MAGAWWAGEQSCPPTLPCVAPLEFGTPCAVANNSSPHARPQAAHFCEAAVADEAPVDAPQVEAGVLLPGECRMRWWFFWGGSDRARLHALPQTSRRCPAPTSETRPAPLSRKPGPKLVCAPHPALPQVILALDRTIVQTHRWHLLALRVAHLCDQVGAAKGQLHELDLKRGARGAQARGGAVGREAGSARAKESAVDAGSNSSCGRHPTRSARVPAYVPHQQGHAECDRAHAEAGALRFCAESPHVVIVQPATGHPTCRPHTPNPHAPGAT